MVDRHTSKPIHHGRLISLSLVSVALPNNHRVELEIVHHPGGAVVVAMSDNDQVCLLRQYRFAAGEEYIWELPAGCIDESDLTPLDTARRELHEEAGVHARSWHSLGSMLPSPGFCDERLHLFLACDLTLTETRQQEDELIEVHWLPFDTALSMAADNQIEDAKTVTALFRAERFNKS